jgi:hypothetical protein
MVRITHFLPLYLLLSRKSQHNIVTFSFCWFNTVYTFYTVLMTGAFLKLEEFKFIGEYFTYVYIQPSFQDPACHIY